MYGNTAVRRVHIGKAPNKTPPVHAMAGFRQGERAGTLEDDDNGLRRGLFLTALSQAACPVIERRVGVGPLVENGYRGRRERVYGRP